jgi:hypothetical protein
VPTACARCWSRRSPANGGPLSALYFRGDTAFAKPEIYEFLEAEGIGYTARLPANRVLQDRIGHLLKRPVGRLPPLFFAAKAICPCPSPIRSAILASKRPGHLANVG